MSLSDPDFKLRHKPGQRSRLVHRGQVAADPQNLVIQRGSFLCPEIHCLLSSTVYAFVPPPDHERGGLLELPVPLDLVTPPVTVGGGIVSAQRSMTNTSSVRGPWTPSTRTSSMSTVADGPDTRVIGRPSAATLASATTLSGTDGTMSTDLTTHRW